MTNQLERADYIVGLYRVIMNDSNINSNTKIKNTTIWKLCETNGGPFQRIKKWCEEKVEINKLKVNESDGEDMSSAFEQFVKCFELMKSRNKSYGSSWKVLSVQSIANLIEMKMNRIAQLGEIDAKSLDEFQDCANYAVFALMKLNNK